MKVLLGIGGSADGFNALDRTIERSQEAADELTVAVVENPTSSPSTDRVAEMAERRLADAGVAADVVQLAGHPGSELVAMAERQQYDQLVLGGGESSPLGKVSLGQIAEFVVLNATVTVTLIR